MSTTWHMYLTVWLRSVTLIQSVFVSDPFPLTFYLQVTFSMKCFWLFTMSIRTRSDDGKHRNRTCAGEHCFFQMKKCGLIERKMLHYTKLSIKLYHCTLSEIKTQVFTLSDVLACVSILCADQKQHSNRDYLLIIRCKRVLTQQMSTCRRKIQR